MKYCSCKYFLVFLSNKKNEKSVIKANYSVATTGTKDTIYVICFSLDYATLGVSPREHYPRTGSPLTTEKHGDTDICTKLPKSLL